MNEREKIAAKIRALLSKTTDNGCTEDEAISAALKAKELMDKHEIDLNEADLVADGYDEADTFTDRGESFEIQLKFWSGVSKFTETRVWVGRREEHFDYGQVQRDLFGADKQVGGKPRFERGKPTLHFFGLKGDVMFANWLVRALENYIVRAADSYMLNLDGTVKRGKKSHQGRGFEMKDGEAKGFTYQQLLDKRISFIVGAAERINERLLEEWQKRVAARASAYNGGKGLIKLDKAALISAEMNRRGIIIRGSYSGGQLRGGDSAAFGAGSRHGDSANFSRPVNGGGGVRQIGS